jgi:hypothetical protein
MCALFCINFPFLFLSFLINKMVSIWRVLLSSKLWNQYKYEKDWVSYPEIRRLPQSRGRAKKNDIVYFVYNRKIVMKGYVDSDKFEENSKLQFHSCNIGNNRQHDVHEYVYIYVTEIGLSENIAWKGQRTWVKL